ncbi:alpha/beta fold hydrolase [Thalassotalea sp. PLHSN55]|uniref:alpha/beta fold hydrolase n=1 Tax=Thalassotalea sp. PLHSN55 TaxID=3435888 RepID=UPI003F842299
MRLLLLVLLCVAPLVAAASWLDKLKSGYEEVVSKVSKQDETPNSAAQPLALPQDMPKNWHYSYFEEPVFNSKMAILQTGLEHKETILLVHGLGQLGMKDWYDVMPALADKHHLIVIDLPGFGYSEKPAGRYSPRNYAKILASIRQQYGKDEFIVMGHSMGGAVSLRFAAMYPNLLDQLILVDVAGILQKTAFVKHAGQLPIDDALIPEKAKTVLSQVNDFGGSFIELISINGISKAIEKSDITWKMIEKSANVNAAFSLIEEDFSLALSQVKVNTMIIWGELDKVTPLRTAKVLTNKIGSAQLAVIEGAGHVPMKSHTEAFNALVAQALNGQFEHQSRPSPLMTSDHLHCQDKNNQTYRGVYQTVTIKNCQNIELIDVTANELSIEHSLVNAENLQLNSKTSALSLNESVMNMTNGTIHTGEALQLSGARLDIAGAKIVAHKQSILATTPSKLIFSVSHIAEQGYQGSVHGSYKLANSSLTQQLNSRE